MRTDMLVVPCLTRHVSATSLGVLHAADSYIRLWVRSKGDMTNTNLPLSFFQLMQFQWVPPSLSPTSQYSPLKGKRSHTLCKVIKCAQGPTFPLNSPSGKSILFLRSRGDSQMTQNTLRWVQVISAVTANCQKHSERLYPRMLQMTAKNQNYLGFSFEFPWKLWEWCRHRRDWRWLLGLSDVSITCRVLLKSL